MKRIHLTFFLLSIINYGFSQFPREMTESDLAKFKQEIQIESIKLRENLLNKDYLSDFEKQISVNFQVDTFKIERLLSKRISIDYSTTGMVTATFDSEKEYDKLLNKYYQILLKKLNESDKEILKKSEKNWLQFRESERKLNLEIAKEQYSGGGTIQSVIIASGYVELTKKRLLEIYIYLSRFNK